IRGSRNPPEVRLELLEATAAQQLERIREGGMDIGLLIPSVPDAGDFSFQPFDTDRLCIALPRSHSVSNPALEQFLKINPRPTGIRTWLRQNSRRSTSATVATDTSE
ncbi:LysR substrate-binding domain-containing protein, partial [Nitratireductor sp. ZSWI3]|uniref:LysR substrate-binding domain-containing protein n=1 Tax=Nitratireductor sp. ZSWI3 TaxID=2966359 RepID=UPI0021502DBC